MKVLLCHTHYRQRGGEDQSFEEERELLLAHGHCVVEYVRRNEELTAMNPLAAAKLTLWNGAAAREVAELIRRERPEVLHATNTFPLISPAVCDVAHRQCVAVVQALRNYRLLCANSYLVRDGRPCEACIGRAIPWPAIRHGCYRDSMAATAVVAGMQVLHRALGVWRRKVDAFFTLTHFAREKFISAGLPPERIHVKYNSVSEPGRLGSGRGDGGYVVFVGRLSPEKGVATLLEAWKQDRSLPPLKIAGDGPLASVVQAAAAADPRIQRLGQLPLAEVNRVIGGGMALVMPSVWYETFGRTIAEAFAVGTPVIASNLGAMAELVADGRTGRLFEAGSAAALALQVKRLTAAAPAEIAAMRAAARREYQSRFTPEHNYARLLDIYEMARANADGRRRQWEEGPAEPEALTTVAARQEPRPPESMPHRPAETKPATEAVPA